MKPYRLRCHRRADEPYETLRVLDENDQVLAEYRLTRGKELSEIAAMAKALDQHLAEPGATRANYQW